MGLFRIGETDRYGRQKRIEHAGRHLRVSRTGGVSLRAQTRAAGINATANSRHGLRLSTRLARNTQVAMQNGRFVLRGRYGSDAARFNLSKSGVTVSSRTGIGSLNWVRPNRSSARIAGIQVRGRNALALQGVYLGFTAFAGLFRGAANAVASLFNGLWRLVTAVHRQRLLRQQERDRLGLDLAQARQGGLAFAEQNGMQPQAAASRDLLAALALCLTVCGRGGQPDEFSADSTESPERAALRADMASAAPQLTTWLGPDWAETPERLAEIVVSFADALGQRLDADQAAELLLALDDACLADGPKTLLQEDLLDLLADALDVGLALEGEA